jgi:hypothetical protein
MLWQHLLKAACLEKGPKVDVRACVLRQIQKEADAFAAPAAKRELSAEIVCLFRPGLTRFAIMASFFAAMALAILGCLAYETAVEIVLNLATAFYVGI